MRFPPEQTVKAGLSSGYALLKIEPNNLCGRLTGKPSSYIGEKQKAHALGGFSIAQFRESLRDPAFIIFGCKQKIPLVIRLNWRV